jgi:hypothetical protein
MATYGLRTYDAGGNILVDITSKLNRYRYANEVSAGVSDSTVLADIDGQLTIGLSVMINPPTSLSIPNSFYCQHQISRSGTTISWDTVSGTMVTSTNSLLLVFFYV